ncbi:MAG TPA: hypothetical protein VGF34_17080, partial [Stellaceae bacterium]
MELTRYPAAARVCPRFRGERKSPDRGPPVRECRALALFVGGAAPGTRMFDSLSNRLGDVFDRLRRHG